jgi:hypothetical protein
MSVGQPLTSEYTRVRTALTLVVHCVPELLTDRKDEKCALNLAQLCRRLRRCS